MQARSDVLILGGESRARCERTGSAAIISVGTDAKASVVWRDDDPFQSNVTDIANNRDGWQLTIRRQRPLGVRSMIAKPDAAASKRWGDDGESVLEISIADVTAAGLLKSRINSSFGLSAFVQGRVQSEGRSVYYGSLAGRPAMSVRSQ